MCPYCQENGLDELDLRDHCDKQHANDSKRVVSHHSCVYITWNYSNIQSCVEFNLQNINLKLEI